MYELFKSQNKSCYFGSFISFLSLITFLNNCNFIIESFMQCLQNPMIKGFRDVFLKPLDKCLLSIVLLLAFSKSDVTLIFKPTTSFTRADMLFALAFFFLPFYTLFSKLCQLDTVINHQTVPIYQSHKDTFSLLYRASFMLLCAKLAKLDQLSSGQKVLFYFVGYIQLLIFSYVLIKFVFRLWLPVKPMDKQTHKDRKHAFQKAIYQNQTCNSFFKVAKYITVFCSSFAIIVDIMIQVFTSKIHSDGWILSGIRDQFLFFWMFRIVEFLLENVKLIVYDFSQKAPCSVIFLKMLIGIVDVTTIVYFGCVFGIMVFFQQKKTKEGFNSGIIYIIFYSLGFLCMKIAVFWLIKRERRIVHNRSLTADEYAAIARYL